MKRILLVDDSNAVRLQVASFLSSAGYAVLEAKDGLEARQLLEEHDDIALVFLDINMPRMNGFEVLEWGQAAGLWASVPVVMLTTEMEGRLIERARKNGARGWLIKPFKPEAVVRAADSALRAR